MKKNELTDIIANNIKKYRNIAGIRQVDLGIQINVSENHIYMLESGRRIPSVETILKIANALNIEPHELLKPHAEINDLSAFNSCPGLD